MTKTYPWHHVHVVIEDWHEAAKWHEEHTGAQNVSWDHRAHRGYKSEVLRSASNLVLVQKRQHSPEPTRAEIDSLGLVVEDLPQFTDKWTDGGGRVISRGEGIVLASDPWGLRCEFVEQVPPGEVGYSHVNIATAEPSSLLAWYEQHLGGERGICEWDADRLVLHYDTLQLVFMQPRAAEAISDATAVRHLDHLGWYTDDLHATCEEMIANGVKFPENGLGGRPNPPSPDGPRTPAFAEDPCGIWIELVGLRQDVSLQTVKNDAWAD